MANFTALKSIFTAWYKNASWLHGQLPPSEQLCGGWTFGEVRSLVVWSASPLLIEGTLTGPPNCAFGFCAFI